MRSICLASKQAMQHSGMLCKSSKACIHGGAKIATQVQSSILWCPSQGIWEGTLQVALQEKHTQTAKNTQRNGHARNPSVLAPDKQAQSGESAARTLPAGQPSRAPGPPAAIEAAWQKAPKIALREPLTVSLWGSTSKSFRLPMCQ